MASWLDRAKHLGSKPADLPGQLHGSVISSSGHSPYTQATGQTATKHDLAVVEQLADWLDTKFEIPGLGVRFGLDAIVGLVPGIGDAVTSLASLYILTMATRHNVRRVTQARMAANIAIDWLVGSIPLLGDLFDVAWKANKMNVAATLKRHLTATSREQRRSRRHDWSFLVMLVFGLAMILGLSISIAYFLIVGIWHSFPLSCGIALQAVNHSLPGA